MRNSPEIIHFETWAWSWSWTWKALWTRARWLLYWKRIYMRIQLHSTVQ